ncbi:chromate transporter [Paenibacillus sp. ACRRX]|uniref:chromate transporter n=1 Tax=unclassified Paenibacillus TaxID=185978 RepID=UPI001EF570C2|nr:MULTISPECIES: chromate transporter [unclassified Paenibacillus]MCG7408522.1 chromate transporter [Paenibacillus sp. ACRRX]MDK8182770.1 chromate transporter [Paenibacillus sp. UMB4589-SE434]
MSEPSIPPIPKLLLCIPLFITFLKIGPTTFGGGYAILPIIDKEVTGRRQWLREDEMSEITALSAAAPGGIGINVASLVGYRIAGLPGLLVSVIGISLPTIVIMLTLCLGAAHYSHYPWVQAALIGIKPTVIALIAYAAIRMGRQILNDKLAWILVAICSLLLLFTTINPLIILLLGASAGLGAAYRRYRSLRRRSTKKHQAEDHNTYHSSTSAR